MNMQYENNYILFCCDDCITQVLTLKPSFPIPIKRKNLDLNNIFHTILCHVNGGVFN